MWRDEGQNLLISWYRKGRILSWCLGVGHVILIGSLAIINLQTFAMAEVSIYLNFGPLLTVLIGGLLLPSESVTLGAVVKVVAAFIGVLFITLPIALNDDENDDVKSIRPAAEWYNYILMISMPLGIAFGNLAMG